MLARAAGLHEKHTVSRHLDVLVLAGILREDAGGYRLNPVSTLIDPLRALTQELERLEPRPLPLSRGAR